MKIKSCSLLAVAFFLCVYVVQFVFLVLAVFIGKFLMVVGLFFCCVLIGGGFLVMF